MVETTVDTWRIPVPLKNRMKQYCGDKGFKLSELRNRALDQFLQDQGY